MPAPNPRLEELPPFPFARLRALLAEVEPAAGLEPLDLSIGEPRHEPPALVASAIAAQAHLWNRYPPPAGTPGFCQSCRAWLGRRYRLPADVLDPETAILPLAGTKEGLFMLPALLASLRRDGSRAAVLMPDPFYAVYLGAAVMGGFVPVPLPATGATGHLPDLDALRPELLARTALFFLCSPANPQGAVADEDYLARLYTLAREYDFLLVVDECYGEIYDRLPPPGALEVAVRIDPEVRNLLVFHSLSKRSNAPGLRSGFVAGDAALIARFRHLRAYAAAVQPLPLMAAAEALWNDDEHVAANRARYRRKFDLAEELLAGRFGFTRPPGGFFLWLDVDNGVEAARILWRDAALRVLPGEYLSASSGPASPGHRYIRVAMVHDEETIRQALERLRHALEGARLREAAR